MGRWLRRVAIAIGFILVLAAFSGWGRATYAEGLVHIVAPGETLYGLALRYGTSVSDLAAANGLANPNLIRVGQKLTIPSGVAAAVPATPPAGKNSAPLDASYIVESGDTLGRIAALYGTSVGALAEINGLANPNWIYPGQKLAIPAEATTTGQGSWVELVPPVAAPGGTLVVRVPKEKASTIQASLGGKKLRFLEEGDYWWALAGLSAWAAPGEVPLELAWVAPSGERGDLTQMVRLRQVAFPVEAIYLEPGKAALLDDELIRRENERLAALCAGFTPQRLWGGRFALPVEGEYSSLYGTGRSYNGAPISSRHEGLDIAAPSGAQVRAAAAGRVVLAGELSVRGNAVLIDHGAGVYSGYYHLSKIAVELGQEVRQGELIGEVGTTGLSTGPHLHWELRVGGVLVSPLEWTERSIPR